MTEKGYFKSGGNKLFYVADLPEDQWAHAGVLFVHAADGNRLGPHRMLVEMADRLQSMGIAAMRFDLTGCGDSSGRQSQNEIQQDVADVLAAIEFFKARYSIKNLYLFGISRGARVSFSVIAENEAIVAGAILLSTPAPVRGASAKTVFIRIKEYIYKFREPENLKKFLTGKANIKQILKTLLFAMGANKRYRQKQNNDFARKRPLLFIYGTKDPMAMGACGFYRGICGRFEIPHKIIEIEGANHSFFHYRWKEQIFEEAQRWLMEKRMPEK